MKEYRKERHCGGFIRPSVVLFGESLSEEAVLMAVEETKKQIYYCYWLFITNFTNKLFFQFQLNEIGQSCWIVNGPSINN